MKSTTSRRPGWNAADAGQGLLDRGRMMRVVVHEEDAARLADDLGAPPAARERFQAQLPRQPEVGAPLPPCSFSHSRPAQGERRGRVQHGVLPGDLQGETLRDPASWNRLTPAPAASGDAEGALGGPAVGNQAQVIAALRILFAAALAPGSSAQKIRVPWEGSDFPYSSNAERMSSRSRK